MVAIHLLHIYTKKWKLGQSFGERGIMMKDFLKNFADLLKVKTIVTLVVIAVFAVLSLNGNIEPDNVMIIISMVVSFYFGTQHEKSVAAQ